MADKIRVGIIGVQPDRSWAAVAHIPALAELPDYEVTALSTTRQESADTAAARYAVAHAFNNHQALVTCSEVDLVVVAVKVPHHLELVTAAIAAGKHVYCEWPLGNGLAEARTMAKLARDRGVKAVIGLQARQAPAVRYARDLVRQGFIGDVLSTSLIGIGHNWGEFVDPPNAYTADKRAGVTLLTIPVGHTMDAVCHMLGEVDFLSSIMASRRKVTINTETGEALPLTSEDQVAIAATLEGGVVATLHYRGGTSKGTGFLWEINGSKGDLRLSAIGGNAQIFDLSLEGAGLGDEAMKPLTIPDGYYSTSLRSGPAMNVAEAYAQLLKDMRTGTNNVPTFEEAVVRHRMLEAVEVSARTGDRTAPREL